MPFNPNAISPLERRLERRLLEFPLPVLFAGLNDSGSMLIRLRLFPALTLSLEDAFVFGIFCLLLVCGFINIVSSFFANFIVLW